jgi:hypothetical protein
VPALSYDLDRKVCGQADWSARNSRINFDLFAMDRFKQTFVCP